MTPRILDISRLISRVGLGPLSGIDRVELAYMREFLDRPEPLFFLCRMPRSYALLDRAGGLEVYNKIKGLRPWGLSGLARVLAPGNTTERQRALADIWRASIKKCRENGLTNCIKSLFPSGGEYFNVGHSNLRESVFRAFSKNIRFTIIILIHDVIPISYPEYSRPEVVTRFKQDLQRVCQYADLVIYNSAQTRIAAARYFDGLDRIPAGIVAHLGAGLVGDEDVQPIDKAAKKPEFIMIGTIEPRKNHALVLDIWRGFAESLPAEDIPRLHIVGRRGWNNKSVFNRLDNDPVMEKHVFEHNDLSDPHLRAMLAQSWALLFPSFAEGFGLPLIEAAQLGVPIICGENAIYRELLGDYPLYLTVDNSYLWSKRILERASRHRESEAERRVRKGSVNLPDWSAHFDRIFSFIPYAAREKRVTDRRKRYGF